MSKGKRPRAVGSSPEPRLRDAFKRAGKFFTGTIAETNNPGDETERRLKAASEKLRRAGK